VLCGEAALANFIVKNSTGEGNQKNFMSIRNVLTLCRQDVLTLCRQDVLTLCRQDVLTLCRQDVLTLTISEFLIDIKFFWFPSPVEFLTTSCLHKVKCDITFMNEFDYNSPKSILTVILCI
jgi:hypothetical protein